MKLNVDPYCLCIPSECDCHSLLESVARKTVWDQDTKRNFVIYADMTDEEVQRLSDGAIEFNDLAGQARRLLIEGNHFEACITLDPIGRHQLSCPRSHWEFAFAGSDRRDEIYRWYIDAFEYRSLTPFEASVCSCPRCSAQVPIAETRESGLCLICTSELQWESQRSSLQLPLG